jgi:phosphate starvation-inducible protein PhoH
MGDNCRMIILGDTGQDDISSERYREESGLSDLIKIMKSIPSVGLIEMGVDDIVRHGFVKNYIIAEYEYFSKF